VVRVLTDVPAVPRSFDYSVPARWRGQVAVGSRVRVRLHGRPVGGWVVGSGGEPPAGVALLSLTALSGMGPSPRLVSLAQWAAWRWAGPVARFLRTASPARNVTALPAAGTATSAVIDVQPTATTSVTSVTSVTGLSEAVAAALARRTVPSLLRLAPYEDLLALVLAVVAGAGPGVLVLVPNLGWASRLGGRLERRGVRVARSWAEAAAGWPVVVGARAAAWAPRPQLSAVVVLDAHDEAYQEERTPTAAAWEVAAERARRAHAPCLLVSPCPSATQVARFGPPWSARRDLERSGWPALTVVDLRPLDPRTGLFSEPFVALARRALGGARPVVCVLNRTGRAKLLACRACGELLRCATCRRPSEEVDDELRCRWCGARRPVLCVACGATRVKRLRLGVSRAREELAALLGVEVGEVAGPARPDQPLPDAPLVIGTEAVLHRLRHAAAVAFLDFDQHLLASRYVAADQALALLARAGRLVGGRGAREGSPRVSPEGGASATPLVLVQTRLPDHEVLRAAVAGDPTLVTTEELELRRAIRLPPFAALALLSGPGAPELAGALSVRPGVEVSEIGTNRWLARATDHVALCDALDATPRPDRRVRVAVDPVDV